MNTQFLAKLLLYYRQKYDHSDDNSGSILLIAILLILIISMLLIGLRSLWSCNCADSAVESEAKTYVGSMNRGQQSYFTEYEKFSGSLDKLEIGISSQTTYFNYSIITSKKAVLNYGIFRQEPVEENLFTRREIHDFVGGVFIVPSEEKGKFTTLTIMCKSLGNGKKIPAKPILINNIPMCGEGTENINK